jgi:hypothetical protein
MADDFLGSEGAYVSGGTELNTGSLTVVDLSKVKGLPLNKLATPATPILHNAPVTMLFAVLDPRVALQKHYGHRFYS